MKGRIGPRMHLPSESEDPRPMWEAPAILHELQSISWIAGPYTRDGHGLLSRACRLESLNRMHFSGLARNIDRSSHYVICCCIISCYVVTNMMNMTLCMI